MPQLSLDTIEATTHRALVRHRAADWVAREVARAVRRAEATHNRICGLYYLESYCRQLATGRVQGEVEPIVHKVRPAVVRVDARHGFAQPAFARALPTALEAAREEGVASLAVHQAHTCTSLGYFTEQIAREGLVALGATNASAIVAPPGGRERVLGTNPIAFSVPDGTGAVALHMDQSTTAVALGKITMAKAAGESIPEGWAVDEEGRPTTDPEAALRGSLVSVGGYKGWGFGLIAEILAAALAGGVLSREVEPLKAPEGRPHDLGQYYLLLDPSTSPVFFERLHGLLGAVAAQEGCRVPGQDKREEDPVAIDDALWASLVQLAD